MHLRKKTTLQTIKFSKSHKMSSSNSNSSNIDESNDFMNEYDNIPFEYLSKQEQKLKDFLEKYDELSDQDEKLDEFLMEQFKDDDTFDLDTFDVDEYQSDRERYLCMFWVAHFQKYKDEYIFQTLDDGRKICQKSYDTQTVTIEELSEDKYIYYIHLQEDIEEKCLALPNALTRHNSLICEEMKGGIDVTDSFNYDMNYYRVLRPNDKKYRIGNNDYNSVKFEDCYNVPYCSSYNKGGFYFTNLESLSHYLFRWGITLCNVRVMKHMSVYQMSGYEPKKLDDQNHIRDDIWRSQFLFLSNPRRLTAETIRELIEEGLPVNRVLIKSLEFATREDDETDENEDKENASELTDVEKRRLKILMKELREHYNL